MRFNSRKEIFESLLRADAWLGSLVVDELCWRAVLALTVNIALISSSLMLIDLGRFIQIELSVISARGSLVQCSMRTLHALRVPVGINGGGGGAGGGAGGSASGGGALSASSGCSGPPRIIGGGCNGTFEEGSAGGSKEV